MIKRRQRSVEAIQTADRKIRPFSIDPDINKPSRFRPDPPNAKAIWLKPKLVCEVSFAEMTSDGVMRHPSFEGMRTDKKPEAVVLEKEIPADKMRGQSKNYQIKSKLSWQLPTGRIKNLVKSY